jgi:uncharacterized membrane protein YccC
MSRKKDKRTAEAGDQTPAKPAVSIAAHPRARRSIRRTRARTGLIAFGLVLLLCLNAGVPGQDAALRALVAGLIGNVAGWACALAVWRQLILAELRLAEESYLERRRARAEEARAKAGAAAAA